MTTATVQTAELGLAKEGVNVIIFSAQCWMCFLSLAVGDWSFLQAL